MATLVLGIDDQVGQLVAKRLVDQVSLTVFSSKTVTGQVGDPHKAATYVDLLEDVDVVYSNFMGMDVDWKLEALFEAIRQTKANVRTVVRSVVGVDDEATQPVSYPGITDPVTFLKQQRYAIKIVDEAELPYTVFRAAPVAVTATDDVLLINEGQPVNPAPITAEALAAVVAQELVEPQHVGQSLAVVGKN
ncbi:NAD(P)H-binding protein [Secundilactobacillus kimchicus]|uniref:NAD(P)-binding domain-containing protein n=1 Tax=Secundilactobacillus kimchicus JCM 15530 TaxID=1302272 RepID=A0A0R1I002_9LACO|nr:NAD(P)H-binding protein [Secundilactobacillus kimchicus]KRK48583.1 hypothetical protein FC96_GL001696 [Secundilactobacillus kimchicus JCM 15530]MBT9671328.1 NAD(P)H-binding protein [Secundilactobacillus kimchicus]